MAARNKVTKINIGAGITYIPGFTNIDYVKWADVSIDLNKDKLPFKDNSVDLVFSYHTLEHLDNYLFALKEIHRVLKHRGHFLVGLPYLTLTKYNLINPFHKQYFNEYSFDFFDPDKLKWSAAEDDPTEFKLIYYKIHYLGIIEQYPNLLKKIIRKHLLNVADKIDFGLIAIKDNKKKPIISSNLNNQLIKEFDHCLKSRRKY